MNYIVAQLLLHCTETFAFWLFVSLIEDCEMRDIYEPELSGLFKHGFMIDLLIKANLHDLHNRMLESNCIRASIFAGEWIFGLFASVIPCDQMGDFFDQFFKHKWIFFYKLILSLFKSHEDRIHSEEDFYDFLRHLKFQSIQTSGSPMDKDMDYGSFRESLVLIESSIVSSIANAEFDKIHLQPIVEERKS